MKTFKEYAITKDLTRKNVCVVYDQTTQTNLRAWCEKNNFDLTVKYKGEKQKAEDFEFHTTLIYSENKLNLENVREEISGSSTCVGIDLLGENKDIPVIKIKSSSLLILRAKYEKIGLKDKWPEYLPHISISYDKKQYDLSKIVLPSFDLTYDVLKIEDVDD